jgi:type I restriction enzyme S subunit
MNAKRLLKHYERIADAPGAIARLRRFILDLAVRGKLVPQDPSDEPASELLKRIAKEKVNQSDLPKAWVRATVGEFLDFQYGKGLKASERADEGPVPVFGSNGIVGFTNEPLTVRSSIIVGRKGSAGALNLCNGPSWTTDVAYYVEAPPFIDIRFLLNALASLDLDKLGKGVKPGLSRSEAYEQELCVPPLTEQRRIVAKVDELMALCKRLEAARAGREAVRDRLAEASLARLNAPDPATFQDDACFALDTLQTLTTRPDQIKHLRQTILNLAVRGKLSARGAWRSTPTKLGDVASLQNGYAFKSEWFTKSGTRLLRNANVGHGTLNWDEEVRLPEIQVPEYERFRLVEGDVVLSLDRPFIVTGTKVARIKARDLPALLLQRVGRFVLTDALHPDYLFLWINSPHFSEQIDPGRSNGVPHISSKQVEAAVLFLPPLAEQHRIVAKVDALMVLCDRLEASLATASTTRRLLLDALLAEALAPAEAREMEAAE